MALGDNISSIRANATEALVLIGQPAVEPLVAALNHDDPEVRDAATSALDQFDDPRAIEVLERLGSALMAYSINPDMICGAYSLAIQLGEPGLIVAMTRALDYCGTKEMAGAYLNCGNDELEAAAQSWAKARNYRIVRRSGGSSVRWGRRWGAIRSDQPTGAP